ncbi:tandem-95 repeat protein [Pyxidicoccus parkwayensis]|uniref:Tandem-95 repeat protein n=1 Tax=Pyxidicoccus parkwayensis TaxID=2813578 RepID=A0ABX7NNY5_9BACT|nr:Ig-like domain-containing protein [Pyxidicoccus parkwaysis]QSQ19174.1 tandem-95 repeat protein [Pyxidicoccus parkwaysis]
MGATTPGPAYLPSYGAALAWGTSSYLAVWSDERHSNLGHEGEGTQIYAARLNASGEVLDPVGIRLSTTSHFPNSSQGASVAADSTGFFVVWVDSSNDGLDDIIRGARVGMDGQVLWAGTELIRLENGGFSLTRLAFTGDGYLLVWDELSADTQQHHVRATRVGLDGAVLNPEGEDLGVGVPSQVVWTAQGGLVVYVSGNAIRGVRVNARGEAQGGFPISAPEAVAATTPELAFDGTNYLVVWSERASQTDLAENILGARVSLTEGVQGAPFFIRDAPGRQYLPQVIFNGTNYVVTWQDDQIGRGNLLTIQAARVSPSGAVLDADGYVVMGNPSGNTFFVEDMATSGTDILVAWVGASGSVHDPVYTSRLNLEGAPLTEKILVSSSSHTQLSPSVASDGHHHLVVWTEPNALPQGSDIFGTFLDDAGVEVTPGGFAITQAARNQQAPAVAFDGTHFLVTWTETLSNADDHAIMGRRIPAFGAPVTPEFRIHSLAGAPGTPRLACDAKNCLVVWYQPSSTSANGVIRGTRVDANNVVLSQGGLQLTVSRPLEGNPSVSFDGTHFLLVYSAGTSATSVQGVLVGSNGQTAASGFTISAESPGRRYPSVAFDGTNHVVAWVEGSQVRATRVSPEGIVLETPPWALSPVESSREQHPTVVSDGISSLVLWASRPREGASRNMIHGARTLASDSTPGAAQVLASAPWSDTFAAGASARPGQFLVAYSRFEGPPHGAHRIFTRKAGYNTAPQVEDRSLELVEGTPVEIALTARDLEEDALTFSITRGPQHGSLTGTPPNVIYTPEPGFRGEDSFQFTAKDWEVTSSTATVRLTVKRAPVAPQATPFTVQLDEDTSTSLRLLATDENGDTLTYEIGPPPMHGSLTGTPPNLTYTPHADFQGTDLFEYVASDGTHVSAPARVTITVAPVDDAPVAEDSSHRVYRGSSVDIVLQAHDVDGDPLTYAVTTAPQRGTLTGTPPNLVYTPFRNARAPDSIVFSVSDGKTVVTATASIVIQFDNLPPMAHEQRFLVDPGASIDIELDTEDPDGDALTYVITERPASGTLSGEAPRLRFQASDSFTGEVSFTYVVSDGLASMPGRVVLQARRQPVDSSGGSSGGCTSSGGAASPLLMVLGVLALLARRQRSRSVVRERVTEHLG